MKVADVRNGISFLTILQYAVRGARMLCRERFTDTHDSDAVANSGAFGKRCERQGVCDGSGVYVAQRVVEIIETGIR